MMLQADASTHPEFQGRSFRYARRTRLRGKPKARPPCWASQRLPLILVSAVVPVTHHGASTALDASGSTALDASSTAALNASSTAALNASSTAALDAVATALDAVATALNASESFA
jgi:hypothetical protein